MQHLDDGQLHAYLDGELAHERPELEQHLAQCGECRTRLEAARGLRERAQDVLHAAGPANTTAPPFEQVVRRAQGQGRRTRTPTHVILAWAASLAVAVTAGWYARGLLPTGHAPAAIQLARAPSVEARPPAQAAEAQPPTQVAQAGRSGTARRAPAAAAADTQPPSAERVAAATPEGNVTAAPRRQADMARAAVGAVEKGVTASEPAAAKAAAARAAPSASLQEVVVTGTGAAAPAWTTASRPVAEKRLGGQIATIPGLPLLGFAVSGTGSNTVVRTIQVLSAGTTIELYQRHAGAHLDSIGTRPLVGAGTTSLTVNWEGYSVTGTAPVPADSLQKLLARLGGP